MEHPKSERNVRKSEQIEQKNVWISKTERFHNQTKSKSAKIQTFGFRTFTVNDFKVKFNLMANNHIK